jgi:hypothetical protein
VTTRIPALLALGLAAGAGAATAPAVPALSRGELGPLAGARWTWLGAACADGAVDLNQVGFERTLVSELNGDAALFTYDTALAEPSCTSTEVWGATPGPGGQWRFTPEARVVLPVGTSCGAMDREPRHGLLRLSGETLEQIVFGSAWCRGFDVRFTYRRVPARPAGMDELVRRYVAHWNRRDAAAVASLFDGEGVLIEPFTRSADGAPVRHEGRAQIEAWLASAFGGVTWLALQLDGIEAQSADQALVSWSYMDSRLAEPLSGRNLFVMAGGEIFATELQLLAPPVVQAQAAP